MAKKILIIDDEQDFTGVAQKRLETYGYRVMVANDGEAGMEMAKVGRPDVIILDVEMPRKDGYTFVREYKETVRDDVSHIIMLTVKDRMKDYFEIEGVRDYLVKPFSFDDLLSNIISRCGPARDPDGS